MLSTKQKTAKSGLVKLSDIKTLFPEGAKSPLFLIFVGALLISFSIAWRLYSSRILSFNGNYVSASVSEEASAFDPALINVEKVGISLAVSPASIVDGVWEISFDGASHLDTSASPGEGGNVVVYGHNKTNLFGPIRWLSVGDTVELTNTEGEVFTYEIVEAFETTPDDISHVLPKDEETLTLYTCTGFLDSKRHIIIAKPKS